MQELRFVLIIVGALAIAALLFHGLWTSKKEGKAKFGDKPLGKLDTSEADTEDDLPQRSFAPEDDFEIIRKERKEPDFSIQAPIADPLIDADSVQSDKQEVNVEVNDIPSFSVSDDENKFGQESEKLLETEPSFESEPEIIEAPAATEELVTAFEPEPKVEKAEPEPIAEEVAELEVIVLNVHCAGDTPFVGTQLFRSMEDNGLSYGEMSIFHCYAQSATTPKVIFSVANMMQPGTLEHDDPADFSTKGISFFMTLPCYGEAEQNFNIMLQTAQRIADDMGGNVLDEARNLMTPNRLSDYRKQIRDFKEAQSA
ncbi:cell division protein ZipA [Vibrio sp. T187]|uniref:cell division protein ZipA n=1 Tax=Vibrio TaxID=662 RepID=UPI0010CA11B0|nr:MULTISPECIES: cell division protein ZipA [Vibrio]MBW3694414.1 cell division protein ZipA [Vibrio sp. T187]